MKLPYGATPAVLIKPQPVGARRQVINWAPLVIGYVVPWTVYCIFFFINSFTFHYNHPQMLFYINLGVMALLFLYMR